MSTPTIIANLALSQVFSGAITSLDEASTGGRACKMWYAQVVSELLPRASWRFAITRTALALKDNDRLGEWSVAYEVPANMVFPTRVLASDAIETPYEFSGTTIYAQALDVVAEYVTLADLSAAYDGLFRAAMIATLAARVCVPVSKNFKREKELIQAAEIAVDRASAFHANLYPARYMNHVPDIVAARMGGLETNRVYPGPEANYPAFDPVGTFESGL